MSTALPPDDNRAANLLCVFWVPFPFTVSLVATRFYCRSARRDLGYDDWTVLAAWVLYAISAAMASSMVLHGGARHVGYLSLDQILYVGKFQIITQVPAALSAMLGKVSVALFIMRISGRTSKWRRWFLIIHISIYTIMTVLNICILMGQCRPVQALWDQSLKLSGKAHCIDPSIDTDVTLLQSSFGAYLDFILALLPLSFIIELKVELRKRIVLCLILGLGVVAGICACIKTAQFLPTMRSSDPTWASYMLYLWTFLELPLVIIAACIPPSKPLWDFLMKGRPIKPSNHSSSYAAGSNASYRIGFVKTSVHAHSELDRKRQVDDDMDLLRTTGAASAASASNIHQTVNITQTTSGDRPSLTQSHNDFSPV